MRNRPLKTGEIQNTISVGAGQIRTEMIQESLQRLVTEDVVGETRVRLKRAYFLTKKGQREVGPAATASSALLERVAARITGALPPDVPRDAANRVFRGFLCECFARLGLEIAKTVTGRIDRDDLVRLPQVATAFRVACRDQQITPQAEESIGARCIEFLRSTHPDDERLKLSLTQAFFFAQLLGIQGARFDPLAEQAFAGAVLYLDTNTLLPRLLQAEAAPVFDEIVTLAGHLGIELRVTRATLDETRRAAQDRRRQLATVVEAGFPDELL